MIRRIAKFVGQNTIGRLPAGSARLSGRLALAGGTPVRNLRYRPWPRANPASRSDWLLTVGPAFRDIFLSGTEGLPQPRQKRFAARWAEYCGCAHGLLLPHGTDALRLALAAVLDHDGLAYGGEVIVPNLSFIASATAALDRRFGVAFVDVDAGTLNIDPLRVEEAIIAGRTRAIMPVHQFGQPADMTALQAIAHRHGLALIEDAAQAHGARWETQSVGSFGAAAAFSFQSAKNLSSGEGGVLTTNDDQVFERAYSLHNAGRSREFESRWEHPSLGWNVRPTEYQAALLLARFDQFDAQQQARAANFARLRAGLTEVRALRALHQDPRVTRHGMYMFVMRYDAAHAGGVALDQFLRAVNAEGVPLTRCYSATMSGQQVMRDLAARRPEYIRVLETPVSNRASEEIVYLASNVFLGAATDIDDIIAAIAKVERHYGR